MSVTLRSKRPTRGITSTGLICLALFVYWHTHLAVLSSQATFQSDEGITQPPKPPCWGLRGSEDTVVVVRTGSTELEDRFRIHLSTSLRCFPHYLIFSDLKEHYHGEHVLDALSTVNDDIKANHADFDIYRQIQSQGRTALDPSALS